LFHCHQIFNFQFHFNTVALQTDQIVSFSSLNVQCLISQTVFLPAKAGIWYCFQRVCLPVCVSTNQNVVLEACIVLWTTT